MTNSKCNEYNVVKWYSVQYTVQKGQEKKGFPIGDLVVKKLNPISSTNSWFTIGNVKD